MKQLAHVFMLVSKDERRAKWAANLHLLAYHNFVPSFCLNAQLLEIKLREFFSGYIWVLKLMLLSLPSYQFTVFLSLPPPQFFNLLSLFPCQFPNLLSLPPQFFKLLSLPPSPFSNLLSLPSSQFSNLLSLPPSQFSNLLSIPPSKIQASINSLKSEVSYIIM